MPQDARFLWEVLYHAIYVAEGETPPSRDVVFRPALAKYVQGWGRRSDAGFLAFDVEHQVQIGAAWLRLFTADDGGYGTIDDETPELSIAVLPGHRGKGVGTQLLTRILETARTRYTAVSLSVASENPAIRLYKRLGFEVVGASGASLTMRASWARASHKTSGTSQQGVVDGY